MDSFLLFSSEFLLFNAILVLVLILASVESLHLYFKMSPAQLIQQFFPSSQQQLMQRLKINELSFFSFMLIWLVSFALAGYFLQIVCFYFLHDFIASYWLVVPALFLATFLSQLLAHWLSQLLPTPAPKEIPYDLCLLGRIATIYKGNARPGIYALARVRDELGHLHYVQVEPEFGELTVHSEVILFGKNESIYLAKLLPEEQEKS